MRYISVRVVNSGGRPVHYARVAIGGYGLNYGVYPEQYTDTEGLAQFSLDLGDYDKIAIYVNGQECRSNITPQAEFTISV